MSRSRFGGLFRGRNRLFSQWNTIRSSSSTASAPASIQDFSYTDAQGIWNLKSTTQFPKSQGQPLGISSSLLTLTGVSSAFTLRTIDLSDYAGHQIKLVFRVTVGSASVTYRNDVQLDEISIDGNSYSFENTSHSFETARSATYGSFSAVGIGATNGEWSVLNVATGSSGTGSLSATDGSYFIYTETSFPVVGGDLMWLRSPTITLSSTPGNLTFYEGRDVEDNTDCQLDVFVDVIAQP